LPPIRYPVLQIRNDLTEVWLVPYFPRVIRVKAEEYKLRSGRVSALIGFERKKLLEFVILVRVVHISGYSNLVDALYAISTATSSGCLLVNIEDLAPICPLQ
jgi:hypothetical protein